MSVMHKYLFRSGQGRPAEADLADCVNVDRMPWARQLILDGQFHRVPNPDGAGFINVEKRFAYVHFSRGTYILVEPRGKRHQWLDADDMHRRVMARVPAVIRDRASSVRRVVYGMAELREKLTAEDAGLDDRTVEFLKVLLMYEHPALMQKPRLRITLDAIAAERIHFTAAHDHGDRVYRLSMPRSIVDGVNARRSEIEAWMDTKLDRNLLSAPDGAWVNVWRLSPANQALAILQRVSDALPGTRVDTASKDFKFMLTYLPRGGHLSAWAKKALHAVFKDVKKRPNSGKLQDALWEIRFGRGLDDDWYLNNDPTDIDTLWKLLNDLPDTNVEGNTALNELLLERGEGSGYYSPGSGDITIETGALADKEWFEDTVRHEVGHAVHEMHAATIDSWLATRFGWRRFPATNSGIDAWVGLIGGYGAVTAVQKAEIRGYIRTALGAGEEWDPPSAPVAPASHPWNKSSFAPRLAFERTGGDWFDHHVDWYRKGNQAFFYNFWYAELMVVNVSALTLIKKMPSSYAAMSPFEFFAELYALYYDLDDPARTALPQNVMSWMSANIGAATPDSGLAPRHFRIRPAKGPGATRAQPSAARRPQRGARKKK
jgi:hypothetical protein